MDMLCYFNYKTGKVIALVPEDHRDGMEEEWYIDDLNEVTNNESDYILLQKPHSSESFEIMANFVETVKDPSLRSSLSKALQRSRLFRNFKDIIDDSGAYRDAWFKFRDKAMENWLLDELASSWPEA